MRRFTSLQILALMAAVLPARSDSPLPPPDEYAIRSPNGRFEARFTLSPERTVVTDLTTAKRLWSKQGFHRPAFLANDGRHLVACHPCVNLIPVNSTPDLVLIEFFDRSKSIRRITLGEIIRDQSRLARTVSHLYWGGPAGFDADGRFCVETVEKRRLKYDSATGRLMAEEPVKPSD
jgi:hypothetical protein